MRIIKAFYFDIQTLEHLPNFLIADKINAVKYQFVGNQEYLWRVIVGLPSDSEMLIFRVNSFDLTAEEFVNPALNESIFLLLWAMKFGFDDSQCNIKLGSQVSFVEGWAVGFMLFSTNLFSLLIGVVLDFNGLVRGPVLLHFLELPIYIIGLFHKEHYLYKNWLIIRYLRPAINRILFKPKFETHINGCMLNKMRGFKVWPIITSSLAIRRSHPNLTMNLSPTIFSLLF